MKYLLILLFIVGIYFHYPFSLEGTLNIWGRHPRISYSLCIGIVFFGLLNKNVFKFGPKIKFISTFFHELMHAIVALLTGGRVINFRAGEGEGVVHHLSKNGRMNDLITIAPYNLPLVPFVWLMFVYFSKGAKISLFFSYLFGISYAFYLVRVFYDARPYQTDLIKLTLPIAYLLILVGNLFFVLQITSILKFS